MSINVAALRAALIAALDSITEATADGSEEFEGVPLASYFANRGLIERERPGFGNRLMIEQYRRMREAHPFDPSLRAGIMGTGGGSPNPKSWDTHGRILDAAQGGELNDGIGWTVRGNPFRRWDYMGESTAGKHAVLMEIWNSDKGHEWRANPDNASVLPKGEPQL